MNSQNDPSAERPDLEGAVVALLRELASTPDEALGEQWVARFCKRRNRGVRDVAAHVKKRAILPFYLRVKERDPERWASWGATPELDGRLVRLLRAKPRRTASGVATITVITKPWPCSGTCRFCPSDLRMPKSYLADEPACQRAEQCFFDPFLQVSGRLDVLSQMGHPTDKIELIVLGGTWTEYPAAYQRWFAWQLFCALNAGVGDEARAACARRRARYEAAGLSCEGDACAARTKAAQAPVSAGERTYNEAFGELYGPGTAWGALAREQTATAEELRAAQKANESAANRCVGLSFETRPDAVTASELRLLRELGCTKVQVGVQSTREDRLAANGRPITAASIARTFALLRLFGFKIHGHFMANLLGADPAADKDDYRRFVNDPRFEPDEVKLYPCALIEGTQLARDHAAGRWEPYGHGQLLDLMVADVLATPPFVRVSRMIRDFSAKDILAGDKTANLRQMVEAELERIDEPVHEIRFREVALAGAPAGPLELRCHRYLTTVSQERFLQWTDRAGRIHGFLRLSLPDARALAAHPGTPLAPGDAMIREVHVYGRAARLGQSGDGSQHHGLGRKLVEEACRQAKAAGCRSVLVISAVGTRAYYRGLGFVDDGLYQRRWL